MAKVLAGVSFPFRKGVQGLPAKATGQAAIKSALIGLLRTPVGSRVMRPDLGVDLYASLFEDADGITAQIIKDQILEAVSKYIPQVRIVDIESRVVDKKMMLNIRYSVQGVLDETGSVEISS